MLVNGSRIGKLSLESWILQSICKNKNLLIAFWVTIGVLVWDPAAGMSLVMIMTTIVLAVTWLDTVAHRCCQWWTPIVKKRLVLSAAVLVVRDFACVITMFVVLYWHEENLCITVMLALYFTWRNLCENYLFPAQNAGTCCFECAIFDFYVQSLWT